MSKPKMIYRESYKSPGIKIADGFTPVCRHQKDGFRVVEASILQAGAVEVDGVVREFHDIRVFFGDHA